jgi:UDP-N-acetyl-D-mannosaminuronate dehydrogenase
VSSFEDASGVIRESRELGDLIDWADAIVVLVTHRAIDWDRVYGDAALVVDTVNSSRERTLGDRQVLRLGAGWSNGG